MLDYSLTDEHPLVKAIFDPESLFTESKRLMEGRKQNILKLLRQLYSYLKRTDDPTGAKDWYIDRLKSAGCTDLHGVIDDVADVIINKKIDKEKELKKIYKRYFPKAAKEEAPTTNDDILDLDDDLDSIEDPRQAIPGSVHYNEVTLGSSSNTGTVPSMLSTPATGAATQTGVSGLVTPTPQQAQALVTAAQVKGSANTLNTPAAKKLVDAANALENEISQSLSKASK